MTRDQQIRKALQLLAPPSRLRAECLQDIKVALNRVEHDAAGRAAEPTTPLEMGPPPAQKLRFSRVPTDFQNPE
jgi:hypothetical protein